MQDNFENAVELVLKSEGGFVNDPQDHGGATNFGVTLKAWSEYVNREVGVQEIKDLTPLMVKPFYKRKYWNPAGCETLPKGVDYAVFDFAVNSGVKRAIITLQKAIGADADGVLGSITQALVKQFDPLELLDKFSEEKKKFYQGLNQPRFEKGWLNRVATVQTYSEKMIQNA
jgi:lysozyme family protein